MKILKIIGVVFCGLMTLSSVITFFSDTSSEPDVFVLILTLIFLIPTVLLIRSLRKNASRSRSSSTPNAASSQVYTYNSKPQAKTVSPYLPEVPTETLRDMKKHYGTMQIQNDVRIMQESFQLVQKTTDFDTFFMRLELAQQKALTLLQAVQVGCKGISNKQELVHGCESVLSNVQNAKMVFLDNSYKKETASALQLKTKAGQYKRLAAYLERLKSYENQFADAEEAYRQTVDALQGLIAEYQLN